MILDMTSILALVSRQIGVPPATPPSSGDFWSTVFGPLLPLVSGGVWFLEHLLIPIALIAGVVIWIFGLVFGSKLHAGKGRSIILGIPYALFVVAIAGIAANWIIGKYGVG